MPSRLARMSYAPFVLAAIALSAVGLTARRKRKPAAPPPPPLTSKRTRQTPAEKSVAKRVQQAMELLQTGAMQFADVHGTGASVTFTARDGTFEVEIKRGDDADATQD